MKKAVLTSSRENFYGFKDWHRGRVVGNSIIGIVKKFKIFLKIVLRKSGKSFNVSNLCCSTKKPSKSILSVALIVAVNYHTNGIAMFLNKRAKVWIF